MIYIRISKARIIIQRMVKLPVVKRGMVRLFTEFTRDIIINRIPNNMQRMIIIVAEKLFPHILIF